MVVRIANIYIEVKAHLASLPFCVTPNCFYVSGTSETQVFDEQSPSGSDYLAEVKIRYIIEIDFFTVPAHKNFLI